MGTDDDQSGVRERLCVVGAASSMLDTARRCVGADVEVGGTGAKASWYS